MIIIDIISLAKKDLVLEFRKKETLYSMGLFSFASVLIFSTLFNLPDISFDTKQAVAAACLWFIIVFMIMLGLTSVFSRETKKNSIDSLLSLAIKPQVIFLAKLVYLIVILAITEALTLVLAIIFMNINIENLPLFFLVLIIGTLDLAVAGCIVSFLTIYAKSRTLAVPVLFFPLILPSILIVTQSTESLVFYNDPIYVTINMLILLFHTIIILTFALLVTDELVTQ